MSDALGRMCDAAAFELARLTNTFGPKGIREEMLFPAIFAANGMGSTSLTVEARQDGKGKGAPNSKGTKQGAPPRTDFLLFHRSDGMATHQLAIEMKIAKLTSSKIKISGAQISGTCDTLSPHYFKNYAETPEQLGGVLIAVMRVAKKAVKDESYKSDLKLCRERLPVSLRSVEPTVFSRIHGASCLIFAVAIFLGPASTTSGGAR